MSKRDIKFSVKELTELGFEFVTEGGFNYFQYVFDKSIYMTSGSLVTNDLSDEDFDSYSEFTVSICGVLPEHTLSMKEVKTILNIF